ncbi:hypothetical protein MMC30_000375 [Trapelia coarctata]|nr:hypothetical protein [Trapelia coarctata]
MARSANNVSSLRERAKDDPKLEGPKPSTGQKHRNWSARLFSRAKKKNETVVASEASSNLASPNEGRDAADVGIITPDPTVEGQSPRKGQELWQIAYEMLRVEKCALVDAYEAIINANTNGSEDNALTERMSHAINTTMKSMEGSQWTFQWRHETKRVRDQVENIIKIIQMLKVIGIAAANVYPLYFGLPFAGVCVLLPLILNDSEQHTAALDGLEDVTKLISRYNAVEQAYLKRETASLKDEIEVVVIQLYTRILEFQAKAACYFDRSTPSRILLNILKADDWAGLLKQIEKLDTQCRELQHNYDSLDRQEGMTVMMRLLQEQDRTLQTLVGRSSAPDMGRQDVIEMAYVSRPRHSSESRPEYLNVLFDVASWENRAKVLQVPFADVETDAQLFHRIRREIAKTQYFYRSYGENTKWYNTLAWLHWYYVQRIEYVQFTLHSPSVPSVIPSATFTTVHLRPNPVQPALQLHAFNHPGSQGSKTQCLDALVDILADSPHYWGLCIVEELNIVKFFISMFLTVLVALLVGMVSDDLGRSTGATLRASFIAFLVAVMVLGVLPMPGLQAQERTLKVIGFR